MAAASKRDESSGRDGMNGRDGRDGRGSTPIPDPTVRTDDLVERAVNALKDVLETRFDGMDKAIELLQRTTDRIPAMIDSKVENLEKLHEEKFEAQGGLIASLQNALHEVPAVIRLEVERSEKVTDVRFKGVDTQFTERDTRIDQTATTAATAVNAALQAAKEAVREQNTANQLANTKAETGFSEQIKLLGARIEDSKKSQEGMMNDVKDRLTRIESIAVGSQSQVQLQRADTGVSQAGNSFILALVMGAVTIIAVVFAIVQGLR